MGLFDLFKGKNSGRDKALSIYKRGMAKAKRDDHQGAIDDYTIAIEMPDIPPDVQAMTLYNRALVHAAAKEIAKAITDIDIVLSMGAASADIKKAAQQKLAKIKRRSGISDSP